MKDGLAAPPADLRFLKKAGRKIEQNTADVYSYLESLYNSVAETLPDARDEPLEAADVDPYAAQLLRPEKDGKKNQKYRSVDVSASSAEKEKRCLPPGTMKEVYDQYVLQTADAVSFKTFWTAALAMLQRTCCHVVGGGGTRAGLNLQGC